MMMVDKEVRPVSQAERRQFQDDGFFVMEGVIPRRCLELLRQECGRFIAMADEEMDRQKVDSLGLNHRGSRYFISNCALRSEGVAEFTFGDVAAEITRAVLGDTVYLFNDQYVVKCADVGMKFSWHQDSGYVGHPHRPYVSLWCALDDVNEDNGTVYLLPFPRAGTREIIPHTREEGSNDLVGYTGSDPGVPVICPAGSIAVFSSVALHRSGPNRTGAARRIYLSQYSAEPILTADGSRLWHLAEPLVLDGKKVR